VSSLGYDDDEDDALDGATGTQRKPNAGL
jgi:hypothetical protein